jgi:hypothetical protein
LKSRRRRRARGRSAPRRPHRRSNRQSSARPDATSSPARVGCGAPACRCRRHRHDLEAKPADHAAHFFIDIAQGCDHQGLRHGPGRCLPRSPGQAICAKKKVLASCGAFPGPRPSGGPGCSYRFEQFPACRGRGGCFRRYQARHRLPVPGQNDLLPASARRINSVSCPLALVIATRIVGSSVYFADCEPELTRTVLGTAPYFARLNSSEPLSAPPALATPDSAASSLTLARIGPNGPKVCCSRLNPSA